MDDSVNTPDTETRNGAKAGDPAEPEVGSSSKCLARFADDSQHASTPAEEALEGQLSIPGTESEHYVTLNIDYRIIEHFSDHLYASENKALEELVSNGFDALATQVFVYTPGKFTTDRVVVWDNGQSMTVEGLQKLWFIGDSPKQDQRTVEGETSKGKIRRTTIGKFGIGKLASYVVGNQIIHVCKADGEYYAVGVDYGEIRGGEGKRRPDLKEPLKKSIYRLTEKDAREYVNLLFTDGETPAAVREIFQADSWTLAVIGDLKVKNLKDGRLRWVLGNGLPLREDFTVWVNDDPVASTLEETSIDSWSFDDPDLRAQVQRNWKTAKKSTDSEERVGGIIAFDTEAGLDPNEEEGGTTPYVKLPQLGKVWGRTRIFDESLLKGRHTEHGRSHGFFVFVLGRLINPFEPQFHHHAPQYGTFNRCQIVLHIDGLDEEILADRKSIQEGTDRYRELKILLKSTYQVARNKLEEHDEEEAKEGDPFSLLPTRSSEHYRRPLLALLDRVRRLDDLPDGTVFNLDDPELKRSSLGEGEGVARIAQDMTGFEVNTSHPFYQRVSAALEGSSKKAKLFRRWYDLFAISDLLFIGQLYDLGLAEDLVQKVKAWRNALLETMARSHEEAPAELIKELKATSYGDDAGFEEALAAILIEMGFKAERVSGSGREDVLLEAAFGPDSYKLVFDAKSSKGAVSAKICDVSGVEDLRKKAGAEHAVIVAREFEGFKTDGEPKIMRECKGVGTVSIMTTECAGELLEAIEQYNYPLDVLRKIFFEVEPPEAKLERIRGLKRPTENFDWKKLIKSVETHQRKWARGKRIPLTTVQMEYGWGDMDEAEFSQRVAALVHLGEPLVRQDDDGHYIFLRQSAEIVIRHIQEKMAAEGDNV